MTTKKGIEISNKLSDGEKPADLIAAGYCMETVYKYFKVLVAKGVLADVDYRKRGEQKNKDPKSNAAEIDRLLAQGVPPIDIIAKGFNKNTVYKHYHNFQMLRMDNSRPKPPKPLTNKEIVALNKQGKIMSVEEVSRAADKLGISYGLYVERYGIRKE